MVILSILYGVLFVLYIAYEFIYMINNKKIGMISIVRALYSFVNGLLPSIIYFRYGIGDTNTISYIGEISTGNVAIMLIFSIIGYMSLTLGYNIKIVKKNKPVVTDGNRAIHIDDKKIILLATGLMVIGYISLLIWTSSHGGITSFMKNAALIRSGYSEIYNKYAFFKHFAKFLNFSFLIIGTYFLFDLTDKSKRKKSFKLFILTGVSFFGAFLFLLASDSRGNFGATILVMMLSTLILNGIRKKRKIGKQIFFILFAAYIGFMVTYMGSEIANYFRYENYSINNNDKNFINLVINEFAFVIRSQNKAIEVIFTPEYNWKLFDDISGSIISWLPTRLKPYTEPQTLWEYNTLLIKGTTNTGTQPTDLLTASLYLFHIIGPFLLPNLLGQVVRITEKKINLIDSQYFQIIIKCFLAYKFGMFASHYMLRSIVYENMYLIIGLVLVLIFGKRKNILKRNIKSVVLSRMHQRQES